jgi:hypothetical protein
MWAQAVNVALGVWLTAAPAALGYAGAARTTHLILGPIVAALAAIAIAECTRGVRRANIPPGAWLVLAPLLFGFDTRAGLTSALAGAVVIACSILGGGTRTRFGGGWAVLWRRNTADSQ